MTKINLDDLKILISQGESQTLEFKKSTAQLHPAFKTLCAFLNGDGGTVLIGITDQGEIVGQDVSDNTQQAVAAEISKLEPPAQIAISYLILDNNKQVIVLEAQRGLHAPYVYDGRPYQRDLSTTKMMSQQRYDQLVSKRAQLNYSWERFSSTLNLDYIDHECLISFVESAVKAKRLTSVSSQDSVPLLLKKLGLLKDTTLLNAAIVLFGKDFSSDYPQCQLKLARFKGKDRHEFIDSDLVFGNAFTLLEKGMLFIENHLPVAAKIIPGKLERVETPLIPYEAIREALINSIAHRLYSRHGGSIGVGIYDDRLEISNTGGLQHGISLEMIKAGYSELRNPLIAKILYMAGYIEMWGRGVPEIINSCLRVGDPEPEFIINDDISFLVKLKFPTELRSVISLNTANKEQAEVTGMDSKLNALTKRQREILIILMSVTELSVKQLATRLSDPPTDRTIRSELMHLKKLGLVSYRGKARNIVWFFINSEDK